MIDKAREYLTFGVDRIVLVDPITQSGSLYQKGKREVLLFSHDEEVMFIEGVTVKIKDLPA